MESKSHSESWVEGRSSCITEVAQDFTEGPGVQCFSAVDEPVVVGAEVGRPRYLVFVIHAAGGDGAIEFAVQTAAKDEFLWYRQEWNQQYVRRLTRQVYDEMASPEIDAGWKGFDEPPTKTNRTLPAVKRIMRNCAALTRALLPDEVKAIMFSGEVRLMLLVTLSLHFIPWELLADGDAFLVERSQVMKVIL